MKNKILEIEQLREAVVEKHFPNRNDVYAQHYMNSNHQDIHTMEHAIDQKVLWYLQLGLTAKDLKPSKG